MANHEGAWGEWTGRMKKWANAMLIVFLAAAAMFFGWDLKGGRRLLVDSLQEPMRTTAVQQPGESSNMSRQNQPPGATAAQLQTELESLRTGVSSAEKQIEVDERRLDALRARAADIQLFVTILLGFGTLYAAAQAAFAYFNLQAVMKNARDDVQTLMRNARDDVSEAIKAINRKGEDDRKRQGDEWQEFQKECQREFPRFAGMDRVKATVIGSLANILDRTDVAENLFDEMTVAERQRVFFYEKSVAGLEYLQTNESAKELFEVFRGLGVFYVDKFKSDHPNGLESAAVDVDRSDLDRGEFYFDMALTVDDRNDYRILNDRGIVQSEIYKNPKASENLWEQSIRRRRNQQRAYYDLGTSKYETKEYSAAVKWLREGAAKDRWEETRNELKEGSLHYNLACSLCQVAMQEQRPEFVTEARTELKAAVGRNPKLLDLISKDEGLQILMAGENGKAELVKFLQERDS